MTLSTSSDTRLTNGPHRLLWLAVTTLSLSAAVHAGDWSDSADLWDRRTSMPTAAETIPLRSVRFHVIKAHEPQKDGGYQFLHGVALVWHQDRLYASWGHNRGKENTAGEEARGRVSSDGGRTWSDTFLIDDGGDAMAVSHGAFLSVNDRLWAFQGAFEGKRKNVHTRAWLLDETSGDWIPQGKVIGGGFWPMEQPKRMDDGNWMMGGLIVGNRNPAAVAISHGDDLLNWDLQVIAPPAEKVWGESTTLVDGSHVLNIARFGSRAVALSAFSEDHGRHWTASRSSNLPMVTSKPIAGTLSTGQHYLICTTTADSKSRRSPLTIAVTRPGERLFSRVYRIRDAVFPEGPGDSHAEARLSYPYAVEHDGSLYVGYSNNGGRGRGNINSAELAVIDVSELQSGSATSDRSN